LQIDINKPQIKLQQKVVLNSLFFFFWSFLFFNRYLFPLDFDPQYFFFIFYFCSSTQKQT